MDDRKLLALCAYIIFWIPLMVGSEDEFVKFHMHQGIVIFVVTIVITLLSLLIPFVGLFFISPLIIIGNGCLKSIGIYNVINGEEKKLPLIGGLSLKKN